MGALVLALGLGVVLCNIERVGLAYDLKTLQGELDSASSLVTRLEMERDSLLSPHRLRARAAEFGLEPAGQGRLRRLPAKTPGADKPSQE